MCSYTKKFEIKSFIESHLQDCMKLNNLESQRKADKIIYRLFVKNCRYHNKPAYSNTYLWKKKKGEK